MTDPLPVDLRRTWDAYLELGSVKRAAFALAVDPRTVVRHLSHIRSLLDVQTNAQAADRLAREGPRRPFAEPEQRPRMRPVSDSEFWGWVDMSAGPQGCWPWIGTHDASGYGRHRRAYELAVGPIPRGKMLLHSCDNRPCCNPLHLRPGTARENSDDRLARGHQ